MNRIDGRTANQLRPLTITKDYIKHAEGSVLVEMGDTKVIVTASVEDRVPPFKKGSGEGWLTAEYAMLPRATQARNQRDISKLKLNGRSGEIQRLIGRALRACIDLTKIGERTITVDCDVIQADGGTRTTSIIGGYVAVCSAMEKCMQQGLFETNPMLEPVAAISVGIVQGVPMLDLCYQEDSTADVDMNVVMNGQGRFIEVQGTGEHNTFTTEELQALLALAQDGIAEIVQVQKEALQA